jgi:phage terminase large subunit-like protein
MSTNPELILAAVTRYKELALMECFDASNLESRPTDKQQEVFNDIGKIQYRWVVAGNQAGKSSLAAREISWIVTDKHPFWKRPIEWGTEALLIIVVGQDRKMMELELWSKKIKPFLNPAEWKEIRQGGSLQYVESRINSNRIVFISHNDSSEKNRIHMQGYVAHYVWLDELPSSIRIFEELQRRVDARKGYFLATFTPKFRNEEIKRVVESGTPPIAKIYKMSKLDNPLYADRREEEMKKLDGYPESYKNSILYGDWYIGDSSVYFFDHSSMVETPPDYSVGWRHVESSDPALQSKFGFTLWAECPANGIWYLVKAEYIEGIQVPEDIFNEVMKKTAGYNIVRRISDPHEAWYINTARSKGINYLTPFDKNSRKGELIKNLQSALGGDIRIAPWCNLFINEIETCQWSEGATTGRIVNSSRYHLLDSAQYFVDCRPADTVQFIVKPWYQELREGHAKRKKAEFLARKATRSRRSKWAGRQLSRLS